MEGRPHACIKCDWRPTGVIAPHAYGRPVVWLRCSKCRAPGFRHVGHEVVYTWSVEDPPEHPLLRGD